jgi:hypothetical protein
MTFKLFINHKDQFADSNYHKPTVDFVKLFQSAVVTIGVEPRKLYLCISFN